MSESDQPVNPLRSALKQVNRVPGIVWALLVFAFACFHVLTVDVISAEFFFTFPVGIACLLAGVGLSLPTFRVLHRNSPGFGNIITRPLTYLFVPLVIGGVVWLFLSKSVPWAAAALFGSQHAESHEFTLSNYVRKGCNSVAKPVKDLNMFGYLCVNEDYAHHHAGRIVLIRLVGDRTPLGFRITRIEHESVLGPAPFDRHRR